ncbi:MAG TPA: hypothetical protein PLD84_15485, partial [Chitinophagales bacterium]|nr:hypothetical protein [Chitinophagales bacterium]
RLIKVKLAAVSKELLRVVPNTTSACVICEKINLLAWFIPFNTYLKQMVHDTDLSAYFYRVTNFSEGSYAMLLSKSQQ